MNRVVVALALVMPAAPAAGQEGPAQMRPRDAVLYFDFARGLDDQSATGGTLLLNGEQAVDASGRLEFTRSDQSAVLDEAGTAGLSKALAGCESLSVGGWFLSRNVREQVFVGRGEVMYNPQGTRLFRPDERFINFCLGTDQRGFLMGTINGNGTMPFPHVTVNDIPALYWQQLVVVKTPDGHHEFFQNGTRIHTDREAMSAPSRQPWRETAAGAEQPVRLAMAAGGLVGEVWVVDRALTPGEIAADFEAKRQRYKPAPPGVPVALREMFAHPPASSTFDAEQVRRRMLDVFGRFPSEKPPLEPQVLSEEDCGSYLRRKVSLQVQPDDRMPAYLLIPKRLRERVPAVICFYGTTGGSGKLTTVGLAGRTASDPPHPNRSFAIDLVEAGFVAFAADYLRDGERIAEGDSPYDTTRFYKQFPDWSIHGKDVWDTMRAIDYLQSLDFVDGERIGMIGHSYGGHSTIFAAALEPRIRAAVANGPVSAFWEHGGHWAVPKGGRNSQSLPALRPYLLEPDRPPPITFAEVTALIAPRPLLVGQAAGEHRPLEEENCGFLQNVYRERGASDRVRYLWYAGDHDFPPHARAAAVQWLKRWLVEPSAGSGS